MEKVSVKLVMFKQKTIHEEGSIAVIVRHWVRFTLWTRLKGYVPICKIVLKKTLKDVFITNI